MKHRRLATLLLFLMVSAFTPPAVATECGAETLQIIVRFLKGGVKADDAPRVVKALEFVWQWDAAGTRSFEDLIDLLKTRPVALEDGVANPLHVVRATSGWTNDPAKALLYIDGLMYFKAAPALKPGLDLAYPTTRSTTNLRRVAGASASGSMAEAWEVIAMHAIVANPGTYRTMGAFHQAQVPLVIAREEVESFGRKIADVEADVWVDTQRILFDMKHTIGTDEIEKIPVDLIKRWEARLGANDMQRVLIPVNQPPSATLLKRFEDNIADPAILQRIDFVFMPGIL